VLEGGEVDQARTPDDAGIGSDSLLAAYQLLIESVVESGDDRQLLQRALAVLAAIRWPRPHRSFAACLPADGSGSLRLAAFVGAAGIRAPRCGEIDTQGCLCGLALVSRERLLCVDTAAEAVRTPCDCAAPGMHLLLPLAVRGRTLGMLHITLEPGPAPPGAEQSFLVPVATLLGAELNRRRSEREHDRLETQFLQAQKMEAVGRLAGGVAHDFNNILTAITSHADLALLKLTEASPLTRNLEEILTAAERAALLTQQLLAFSHRQAFAPEVIAINAILAELGKPLRRLLGTDVELSIANDPAGTRILADPVLIEQLIINLMVSARESLPRGGRVALAAAGVDLDAAFTNTHPAATPGRYLRLTVAVDGAGLARGTLRAMCGQADGAQDARAGAALGPAAVCDIIRQSAGHTDVDATPEGGILVRIHFPAANAAAPAAQHGVQQLPGGSETVLLAEDDDSVRVVVAEVLRDLGYRVLEARDGREAQAVAAAHGGEIDALVADVVLPGCGGSELRRSLAATRPALRALFISGTADHASALQALPEPGVVLLSKPFSPWSLASRLRQVLDVPPPAPRQR
jgi:signal transduction histidine kinase